MKIATKFTPQAAALPPVTKRPYATPSVKEFGRVHLLTQGAGSGNGDAGQLMKDKTKP